MPLHVLADVAPQSLHLAAVEVINTCGWVIEAGRAFGQQAIAVLGIFAATAKNTGAQARIETIPTCKRLPANGHIRTRADVPHRNTLVFQFRKVSSVEVAAAIALMEEME